MVAATKWDPKLSLSSKNDFHRPINSSRRLAKGTRELICTRRTAINLLKQVFLQTTSTLRRSARWIETISSFPIDAKSRNTGGWAGLCLSSELDRTASRAHCLLISAGHHCRVKVLAEAGYLAVANRKDVHEI